MFKRIPLMTVLILWFAVVWASGEKYLITLDMNEIEEREQLQELDLSIYHISNDVLIAGTDDPEGISSTGIPFNLIDDQAWSETYYLISDKRGRAIAERINWGRELYRDRNVVLLKTSLLTSEQLDSLSYEITELFPVQISYRYERIYPSRIVPLTSVRTEINDLLAEISPDSLGYFIQSMEDFGTRYCRAPNRDEVADWIKNEFLRFGFTEVVIDSFIQQGIWHKNVVATLPGTVNPEQIVIIGGHHDSINQYGNPMIDAPGADDNATGTSAALEIARAMKAIDYQPETTLRFITFAAEEVGLWGSHHYAQQALDSGMSIKLMLNNDMIGYTLQSPANWTIHLIEYAGFENEANLARQIIGQYTSLTPVTNTYNSPGSDSYPFWIRGYPAVFFIETNFSPYYHSSNDLFIHLSMDYAIETVRASAAIAASINYLPDIPEDFAVTDVGNGTELYLEWSPVENTEVLHYEISVGTSSGAYDTFFTTQEAFYTLSELTEGVTYFIGVNAVGTADYSSNLIENSGTPYSVPLTPDSFSDFPLFESITLTWDHNQEADLAGYNLYRSAFEGETGVQINQELITDNSFTDEDPEAGVYYYYSLTALDESDNVSEPTVQIRSRLVTLDQGVLIVAGTADGNGGFQNPDLDEITQFYDLILSDYSPDIYPLWDENFENKVKLADLGAYSSVVWHKNNASAGSYNQETLDAIKQYLDLGGNILFSVYFPGRLFGSTDSYPQSYEEGDFLHDYLKVDEIVLTQTARFLRADPLITGYPFLAIDEDKAPAALDYHIINVESVQAATMGTNIYSYHSGYPPGSNEASMQDMPVGIEYLGTDYKTILLSFPLYYINQGDAEAFISYVMSEIFNEQVAAGEEDTLPVSDIPFRLYANYPNPFNPETVISFSLEQGSETTLSVYNLKGQKVRVLVSEYRFPGEYSVVWNGKDSLNRETASGIYFYRLTTDFGQDTKKMLLIK
jgi:hypothetical protein